MNSPAIIFDKDGSSVSGVEDSQIKLDAVLQEVTNRIAPVWPLKDYVAVNPYFGLVDRGFMSARTFLRVFSDCEMLMPIDYYAAQWRAGQLDVADLEQALQEIAWPQKLTTMSASDIVQALQRTQPSESVAPYSAIDRLRPVRCLAEHAFSTGGSIDWREIVTDEVSKFCAAHYDDGQASWSNSWKQETLYTAWHKIAQVDRNAELLGLVNMRKLVAGLPRDPKSALVEMLCRLKVPYPMWSSVLLSQVFSIPGWFAWARYQDDQQTGDSAPQAFVGLLAIRLAYDLAVGQSLAIEVDWNTYLRNGYASFQCEEADRLQQAWISYALLRASEIHYRNRLLKSLPGSAPDSAPTESTPQSVAPSAQMVFCIDVRSERMRRQLESLSDSVETFGFAGFFGLPIEFLPMGETQATNQLPVLLKPQHCVHECLSHASCSDDESQVVARRTEIRWWRKLWQSFKGSSISSFGFVESSGLIAGWQLIRQTFCATRNQSHNLDGLKSRAHQLRPSLRGDGPGSLTQEQQIETAVRVLSNLGLTKNFARLVVFCGHHSQTHNNPLAAGLDCGACGGHSGAPNARWLALMLNQTDVRLGLCQRGIVIPPDTQFVAAAHNTTTDEIAFFDTIDLPNSHRHDLEQLQAVCRDASQAVTLERLSQLDASQASDVLRRATDWSEVRPEWGLAGNAAFIVGPRSMTSRMNLNGQAFLHSYDEAQDPNGSILETIMTAPMIVANWINMQYYASTVDNRHFGSGSKAIHNVVGRFGILAGNSGDLQTGLPLQSLHDGVHYRHAPLRLLVVIVASRASIDRIYQKHELVSNLINHQWLSLVAIEDQQAFKLCPTGQWELV